MKFDQVRRTRVAAAIAGSVLAAGAAQVFGSAFALQEQNASGLGQAYAGGAAAAEDVSTIWFNPAGLVRLQSTQGRFDFVSRSHLLLGGQLALLQFLLPAQQIERHEVQRDLRVLEPSDAEVNELGR